MSTSTQQEKVSKGKGNPNPSPSTRFGAERANVQSPGGWKKENTLSYQYNRFLNMSPDEMQAWAKLPTKNKTMAELGAFNRVKEMLKSLPDAKEIADRTEGRAVQKMEVKAEVHSIDAALE